MKKSQDDLTDELRPEYDLKELLRTGVRGKYAKAFPDEQAVNDALRLVLELKKIPTAK